MFVAESAPPAEGVKLKVTGTPALFATRSLSAISNAATYATAPAIGPEGMLSEGAVSLLVETVIGPPAVGVGPMVTPINWTETVEPMEYAESQFKPIPMYVAATVTSSCFGLEQTGETIARTVWEYEKKPVG